MGKRNREKRAAKRRSRQRRGSTPPHGGFAAGPHGPDCMCGVSGGHGFDAHGGFWSLPPAEALSEALLVAAHTHAAGDATAAADCAAELSQGHLVRDRRTVGAAAQMALGGVVGNLWHAGWLPTDLWEITRRNTDKAATSLLVDAIAADTAQHASATVHERWAAQVRQLDATVWWEPDHPHLGQWARRNGVGLEQALLITITLLAELMTLPALPRILPPPGAAAHFAAASTVGVDQKILGRVRALLAKAESTQFPEEAEALSAKAQELMHRHALERALLDADQCKQQTATSTRLWLDNPYVDAKSHLVAAIADANRCKSVFYPKLGFIALVGEQMDLQITDLLTTSLLVQATRAMIAEGSHITHAGASRTRSFRQSFLLAYATRIGERLTEANSRAQDPAEDARLLPVLASRSRAVEEIFQEMFSHTVQKSTSVTNGAGWHAGRAAADRADLTIERDAVNA